MWALVSGICGSLLCMSDLSHHVWGCWTNKALYSCTLIFSLISVHGTRSDFFSRISAHGTRSDMSTRNRLGEHLPPTTANRNRARPRLAHPFLITEMSELEKLEEIALVRGDNMAHVKLLSTPPSTYRDEMRALLDDSRFADITFVVEGEKITAHRMLLVARSVYFRTMLSSGFKEANSNEVLIGDVSISAFKEILMYIYTDELVFTTENLSEVMRKANEFQLERVYKHTLHRCYSSITVKDAVAWLIHAETYNLEEARKLALRFVARNFKKIRAEARQTLLQLKEEPALLMEVMLIAA